MKKFNYFLLAIFSLLLICTESKAFTTINSHTNSANQVKTLESQIDQNSLVLNSNIEALFTNQEFQLNSTESADIIENNLTFLYSLCVALVLVNLVVQIKIIIQMINLFFQFQKKDDLILIKDR